MNYIFQVTERFGPNGSSYTRPATIFLDDFPNLYKFQSDVNYFDRVSYLNEIIAALQSLLDSTSVESYEWGGEIYRIICDADFCRCHDNFDSTAEKLAEVELVLPTNEVLQWAIEWRDFVIQWRIEYLGQDPSLFA
jgi:hypothetical protein